MRLTVPEPEFEVGTKGFDDTDNKGRKIDQLDRKATGEKLSKLVEALASPTVIALDGSWGSGKSLFLKLWAGAHKIDFKKSAEVIYFDAFEHDFLDDPLIALTGAISQNIKGNSTKENIWKLAKSVAPAIGRTVLRVGASFATAGLVTKADEIAAAAVKDFAKTAAELAGNDLNEVIGSFWEHENGKLNAMNTFRQALEALTEGEDANPQKIVIIIDELDRCRPDYALSMLEVMKHFFAVDNVHFVLGVNMKELENSVKARYGSGINAAKYLQKFVHLRMTLPTMIFDEIVVYEYLTFLGKELGIFERLLSDAQEVCRFSLRQDHLSLRGVERFMSIIALAAPLMNNILPGYGIPIVVGAYLKAFDPTAYDSYRENHLPLEELNKMFDFDKNWSAMMVETLAPDRHTTDTRAIKNDLLQHRTLSHPSNPPGKICDDFLEAYKFSDET